MFLQFLLFISKKIRVRNGKIYLRKSLTKLSKGLLPFFFVSCISTLQEEWKKVAIVPIDTTNQNRLHLLAESTWLNFGKKIRNCNPLNLKEIETIQDFFCNLNSFISIGELSKLLSIPIFIHGPHSENKLNSFDQHDFGYYHPEFPIRIRKYFIPALNDSTFRTLTQQTYDLYIKKYSRTFFVVYRKLMSNQEFYDKETERYLMLVEEKRLDPFFLERFNLFMIPDYTDNEDPEYGAKFKTFAGDEFYETKLVRVCVGFWLRRRIDNTETLFFDGLLDLIKTYDLEFYQSRLD